jgi:hypothetical protein
LKNHTPPFLVHITPEKKGKKREKKGKKKENVRSLYTHAKEKREKRNGRHETEG